MKPPALFALCAALITALAGAPAAAGPYASGSFQFSSDSDDFVEARIGLGATADNGWGASAGTLRYSAPGWQASGTQLAATYRSHAPERPIDAALGVAHVEGRNYTVGHLDATWQRPDGAALGVGLERHLVGSRGGIDDGLTYTSAALVGDWPFTPTFNVGFAGGATGFSDGNLRPFLRTRWNLALHEPWALNAYLKTRSYRNSEPDRPQYYSPEHLHEASLGLSARWRVAERVVASVWADAGRQITPNDEQPIWSAFAGLASPHRDPLRWRLGLLASNTSSLFTTQSGAYRYLSLAGQIDWPF